MPIVVGETQPTSTKLTPQQAVLVDEVRDGLTILAVRPPYSTNFATTVETVNRSRQRVDASLGSIGTGDVDSPIFTSTRHADPPWIATGFAVLNEAPGDIRLDVDFQLLAAKRTCDQELI
jgi:hypothetical protein